MFGSMSKGIMPFPESKAGQNALMGDAADGQEGAQVREALDASIEELPAAFDLTAGWLVLRGNASHGVCDHAADQAEGVRLREVMLSLGEACLEQRGVEKVTSKVAPEGPSRAVRTLESGREAHD